MNALLLLARIALVLSVALFSVTYSFGQLPDPALAATCTYNPSDPIQAAGNEKIEHVRQGSQDIYTIHLPDVTRAQKSYPEIIVHPGNALQVSACGCVNTGGKGLTWKRYVDARVRRSSDPSAYQPPTYLGMVYAPIATTPPKAMPGYRVPSDAVPISQWMNAEQQGAKIVATSEFNFTLGYDDDDYGDNRYSDHDDGTDGQCRDLGGAVVQVRIDRGIKRFEEIERRVKPK